MTAKARALPAPEPLRLHPWKQGRITCSQCGGSLFLWTTHAGKDDDWKNWLVIAAAQTGWLALDGGGGMCGTCDDASMPTLPIRLARRGREMFTRVEIEDQSTKAQVPEEWAKRGRQ